MTLLPPDDDLDLIHTRTYETRVYQVDDDTLLARGVVQDLKPPGLYIDGDPEPLEIHQMHVELTVALAGLELPGRDVVLETHPYDSCPTIEEHYGRLVGLSIARGFTHQVRDLFGGPRGCTHTTALLQAMAPAVIQSMWSVSARRARRADAPADAFGSSRQERVLDNVGTCHMWAEDGELVTGARRGEAPGPPLQVRRRLTEHGLDPGEWIG